METKSIFYITYKSNRQEEKSIYACAVFAARKEDNMSLMNFIAESSAELFLIFRNGEQIMAVTKNCAYKLNPSLKEKMVVSSGKLTINHKITQDVVID